MKQATLQQHLIQVARLQNEYAKLHFDFKKLEPLENVNEDRCIDILEELEKHKCFLDEYYLKHEYSAGIFWWRIPCDEVSQYIINHLNAESEAGSWRIEHKPQFLSDGRNHLLYVTERGHRSSFSSHNDISYSRVSQYSEEEQAEMVAARNARIDAKESYNMATIQGAVYSEEQHKIYDSAYDFYHSFEHQMTRKTDSDFYASTLYREKETHQTNVFSNSENHLALFVVASFLSSSNGDLMGIQCPGIKLLSLKGTESSIVGTELKKKDIPLLSFAQLSEAENIGAIPTDLFIRDFLSEFSSFDEALKSAALITCAAPKLSAVEITELTYAPQSEEEEQEYQNISLATAPCLMIRKCPCTV